MVDCSPHSDQHSRLASRRPCTSSTLDWRAAVHVLLDQYSVHPATRVTSICPSSSTSVYTRGLQTDHYHCLGKGGGRDKNGGWGGCWIQKSCKQAKKRKRKTQKEKRKKRKKKKRKKKREKKKRGGQLTQTRRLDTLVMKMSLVEAWTLLGKVAPVSFYYSSWAGDGVSGGRKVSF